MDLAILDRKDLKEILRGLIYPASVLTLQPLIAVSTTEHPSKVGIWWRPQRDSNSCYRRERAVS